MASVMTIVVLRQILKLVIVSNAEVLLLEQILHTNCSACEYSVYQAVSYKVLRALLKISVISIALQCMASEYSVQAWIRRSCHFAAGPLLLCAASGHNNSTSIVAVNMTKTDVSIAISNVKTTTNHITM